MGRVAVRVLAGVAAAILAANFALYFGYAFAMPTFPDPEAGRTVKVQLGGQLWVYVDEGEARIHEIVQTRLFFVAILCALVAAFIQHRLDVQRR